MYRYIVWHSTQQTPEFYDAKRAAAANPEKIGPEPLNLGPGARGWIEHVAKLAEMQEAGCQFRLVELSPEEWRGLVEWKRAIERFRDAYEGCPKCRRAMPRNATFHECGWRRPK